MPGALGGGAAVVWQLAKQPQASSTAQDRNTVGFVLTA
jgi:hypothetical protein